MDEYDDLSTYNGDVDHDMWVDFDNYENTGTPDVFDETTPDHRIDDFDNPDQPHNI
jgi:hypothetical protein